MVGHEYLSAPGSQGNLVRRSLHLMIHTCPFQDFPSSLAAQIRLDLRCFIESKPHDEGLEAGALFSPTLVPQGAGSNGHP